MVKFSRQKHYPTKGVSLWIIILEKLLGLTDKHLFFDEEWLIEK